jgi:hypothetical protein
MAIRPTDWARHLAMPIVTRDARILTYAAAGHISAIAC